MNSYKELALYDLKSAKANYEFELWNKVGKEFQQVCEKYIKHWAFAPHGLLNRPFVLVRFFLEGCGSRTLF